MRYTEVRMSRLAQEFLADLDKENGRFPSQLRQYPHGASGFANQGAKPSPQWLIRHSGRHGDQHSPHNLGELCDALLLLISKPQTSVEELMTIVKGPDFPTAGSVYAGKGACRCLPHWPRHGEGAGKNWP